MTTVERVSCFAHSGCLVKIHRVECPDGPFMPVEFMASVDGVLRIDESESLSDCYTRACAYVVLAQHAGILPARTFHAEVASLTKAASENSEFILSHAEVEAALQPLVARLLSMPLDEARDYIRASYRFGTHDATAVRMFNDQRLFGGF